MRELNIFIDGASKGNPGPSGVGVVICSGNKVLKEVYSYIGEATNNVAEYTALIYGLEEALRCKADAITISTDSELLYRQLKRLYKIKSPNIRGLYEQAIHLLSGFKKAALINIPREKNLRADKLASMAVKKYLTKTGLLKKRQKERGLPA